MVANGNKGQMLAKKGNSWYIANGGSAQGVQERMGKIYINNNNDSLLNSQFLRKPNTDWKEHWKEGSKTLAL